MADFFFYFSPTLFAIYIEDLMFIYIRGIIEFIKQIEKKILNVSLVEHLVSFSQHV